MADLKISQLTGATTPLGGTEEVPLVQSGATKKVSVANLTAGRAIAASSVTVGNGRTQLASTYVADVPGPTGNNTGVLFGGNTLFPCDGLGSPTNGVVSLGNGSYQFNDIHIAGNLIPGTAAKGVNFTANTPAAGMTSQLLNWYEEGTWTPAQGGGLTVVGAFSSTGRYTRIGRQVTVSGTVTGATSVAVTAAGIVTTNLPFTVVTAGHGNATNAAVNASAAVICTTTNVTSASAISATGTITFSATYFV